MSPDDLQALLDRLDGAALPPEKRDALKRALVREAMLGWAGRRIEGETPPPLDEAEPLPRGLCAWCFEPLGRARRARFNDAVGHEACARHAYEAIAGEGAVPWPPRQAGEQDPVIPFLRRLGREAARLGIDVQKLAKAAGRARSA